ncbi:hypothetical protein STCU_03149 [Strigomonas culicis]|uniref:PD-(D/E)XK endonuclease-like domain-containing protein n=1 Tax=Strigomonas culicis TaxID=28005 RepID=S9W7A9_9TRYP|nr:hypothetical protein STCU_07911 [Strigomonas culicis]EPY31875.1 hypothetical protein STCU_03149 [Strigomonas culicis]|eukprot:EPY23047.1 hypothetical protein STCU_07911 [Strigomonas culicis]
MQRIPHPSGSVITFDPKWHQYKMGNTALRSVSKLLDKYFPFDKERILQLVSRKTGESVDAIERKWSRQALLGKNIHSYIEARLLGQPPPTFMLLLQNQQKRAADGTAPTEGARRAEEELLHGEEARYLPVADAAVTRILEHYHVVAVEQVVAAPDWGIAGTIDFIGLNKRNQHILIGDWKTSGSVVSNFRFGSFESPCIGCLAHLPNSKLYRYAMQTFIYGEILKRERYFEKGFFDAAIQSARLQQEAALAASEAAPTDSKKKKVKSGRVAKGKKGKNTTVADATGVVSSTLIDPSIYRNSTRVADMLEYGIVQLSKDDADAVVVEYKEVNGSMVLPPDALEMSFYNLLQKVMMGL